MGRLKKILALLVLFVAYKIASNRIWQVGEVVVTKSGSVIGTVSTSRDGRQFYQWLGIPYAAPPVGELRFESPKPLEPWEGIRETREYGAVCAQMDLLGRKGNLEGAEDCLYLNVFVPKEGFGKRSSPLPVMVWIHGGYFAGGSPHQYNPDYFMDEDVVLVTVGYRLNVLGFLSTQDDIVRGNMGLKDGAMALRWVKDNIEGFGGDPGQITIFGESAGGAAVHYQMMSPLNKGIVTRTIAQSGSALSPWAAQLDPKKLAKDFAARVGCPNDDFKEMVKCLKKLPLNELLQGLLPTTLLERRTKSTMFLPVIETIDDQETFIAEQPLKLLSEGRVDATPLMTGANTEEGIFFVKDALRNTSDTHKLGTDWSFVETVLMFDPSIDAVASAKVKWFYFGDANATIDTTNEDHLKKLVDIATDRYFFNGNHEMAELHAKLGAKVYPYLYAREGPSFGNFMEMFRNEYHPLVEFAIFKVKEAWKKYILGKPSKSLGVCHGDEIAMLFPGLFQVPKDSEHYQFSKEMVKAWVDFACGEVPEVNGVKFPQLEDHKKDDFNYVWLDNEAKVVPYPFVDRYRFWKKLNKLF